MSRPRLLDLFSGAGGAAVGYHRAGFDVVGVDIRPQPRYPFTFVLADALDFLDAHGREYDAIHASPPCQRFTQMSQGHWKRLGIERSHVDLLAPTREALRHYRQPWVIENVPGARRHMATTIILHGGMFGLGVHRPRLFESNVMLMTYHAPATLEPIGVYGSRPDGRRAWTRLNGNGKKRSIMRVASSIEEASAAMGIDWMTWDEIRESIPPAYTEWIGRQLIAALERIEAAS